MAKEKKAEYERVDEKGDEYKRILVKFNPRLLRGSEFEIEFISFLEAYGVGRVFVSEIESMSSIDLYRWWSRHTCLSKGGGEWERGTIPFKGENMATAEYNMKCWRRGEIQLEPRQIISRVKRVYEGVSRGFNGPTAFAYNHFLYTGQLGSLPLYNEDFTIEGLKKIIEESSYRSANANGEVVERSLVEHLFDTHKTKYILGAINNFLEEMWMIREYVMEEYGEKKNP